MQMTNKCAQWDMSDLLDLYDQSFRNLCLNHENVIIICELIFSIFATRLFTSK